MSDSDLGGLANLPEKCQERILSLALGLDRSEIAPLAAPIDRAVSLPNDGCVSNSWDDLVSRGYMISDNLLGTSKDDIKKIRVECEACLDQSCRRGGMGGGGSSKWTESQARGDEITILSLDEERRAGREKLADLMESIQSIKSDLQALGFRVDGKVSFQLARYPGNGARYARHRDSSSSSPTRVITAICYLNQNWDPQMHGGQLCLYHEESSTPGVDPCVLISPTAGRFVVFQSEMEHEVLPAFETRYALTVWFKRESLNIPAPMSASKPHSDEVKNRSASTSGTIFVSIACYRDPECQWTIYELFKKAEFPDSVHVGVVWQCRVGEDDGIMRIAGDQKWRKNVREIRLPHDQATGPCKARKLAESLWAGEDFFLQIDSHVRCVDKWDTKMKDMLAVAEGQSTSGKALLSSYPPNYEGQGPSATTPDETLPVLLCAESFDQDGMLRIAGRRLSQPHDAPIPTLFWAAGFSFSKSSLLAEVPYHDFPFLFFGEEISMLARIWTNGWDVFAPNSVVLFHQWSRKDRPTIWKDGLVDNELKKSSQQSIKDLLQGRDTRSGIQLGDVRSIDQFWKHCGVRFSEQAIEERGRWGGMKRSDFLE
ncbi:hypothetical protein BSKO_00123 [Bryopsis sp. KO-2023]|nr:hypothetical protein BSKO_00123 [Bryopsis sp. KO-2023]